VRTLCGLPLAIQQAGAFIDMSGVSLQNYLQEYQANFSRIWSQAPGLAQGSEPAFKTMYNTWYISFQSLKGKDDEAWSILMTATFLSHDSLPITFFKPCVKDTPDVPVTNHTTTLHNYALIRMKDSGTAFSIHDIIGRCALWYLHSDKEMLQGAMLNAATAINALVDDLVRLSTRADRVAAMQEKNLATHVQCLCENFKQILDESPDNTPTDVDLLESGRFLLSLNYDKPAERILRYMYEYRKKQESSGSPSTSTLECMTALSGACEHFGLHDESLELRERILVSRKEILGGKEWDWDTVASMADLARTYGYHQRYKEAMQLQHQVIAWHTRNYGENAQFTVGLRSDLAQMYKRSALSKKLEAIEMEKVGELDETRALRQQAVRELEIAEAEMLRLLEVSRAKFSVQVQLATQKYLYDIYIAQEQHDKAKEQAVHNLELSRLIYSADLDDPRNIIYMSCLAECYVAHGNRLEEENFMQGQEHWEKAAKLLLQLTELRKSVFGEGHPDTLSERMDLAYVLHRLPGHEQIAEELGLKTLETSKKYLGDDHRTTYKCNLTLNFFVSVYEITKRFKKAEGLQARVMACGDDAYHDPSPDSDLEQRIRAIIMEPRPKPAAWVVGIGVLCIRLM
jgi:tetratricopeptide (TPR) repeat protein